MSECLQSQCGDASQPQHVPTSREVIIKSESNYVPVQETVSERILTKNDILTLLAKNNKQLSDAIEKRDENAAYQELANIVATETGETLLLVKQLKYLLGEITFEEIV